MELCDLCKAIPFHDLPIFPPYYNGPSDTMMHPLWGGIKTEDFEGWSDCYHQPSLDALKQSAKACPLCDLILESTLKAIEALDIVPPYRRRKGVRPVPDFQLRLTRPTPGNGGVFVWTTSTPYIHPYSDIHPSDIFLLAAIEVSVDDEDELASSIHGRPIETDPSSPTTLNRAVKWLADCNSKHSDCESHNKPLPLRVLDVSPTENPNTVALCESLDKQGRYLTLSHCWGTARQFTTTRATIDERKRGIELQELPKTFQDAVLITRCLGERYIWIDSLCICQDDHDDWSRESSKMADIYADSYLNIAALNAASDLEGCFTSRSARKYIPLDYVSKDGLKRGRANAFLLPIHQISRATDYVRLENELLSQRGWTLQERCLAPRTLHFGADQMYFECKIEFLSEDGLCCYHGRYSSHRLQPRQDKELQLQLQKPRLSSPFLCPSPPEWYNLVGAYSRRKLTYITDKLPALSGLAKAFQSQLNDTYVAGLWRNTIIEALYWKCLWLYAKRISPPRPYVGPSWSWVSMDGPCVSSMRAGGTPLASLVDAHVQLASVDPFGAVLDARLKIRAPLVKMVNSKWRPDRWEDRPDTVYWWFTAEEGGKDGAIMRFDEGMDQELLEALEMFVLVLREYDMVEGEIVYYALIVTPSLSVRGEEEGVERVCEYRRLGICETLTKNTLGACDWMNEGRGMKEGLPVVELV